MDISRYVDLVGTRQWTMSSAFSSSIGIWRYEMRCVYYSEPPLLIILLRISYLLTTTLWLFIESFQSIFDLHRYFITLLTFVISRWCWTCPCLELQVAKVLKRRLCRIRIRLEGVKVPNLMCQMLRVFQPFISFVSGAKCANGNWCNSQDTLASPLSVEGVFKRYTLICLHEFYICGTEA